MNLERLLVDDERAANEEKVNKKVQNKCITNLPIEDLSKAVLVLCSMLQEMTPKSEGSGKAGFACGSDTLQGGVGLGNRVERSE